MEGKERQRECVCEKDNAFLCNYFKYWCRVPPFFNIYFFFYFFILAMCKFSFIVIIIIKVVVTYIIIIIARDASKEYFESRGAGSRSLHQFTFYFILFYLLRVYYPSSTNIIYWIFNWSVCFRTVVVVVVVVVVMVLLTVVVIGGGGGGEFELMPTLFHYSCLFSFFLSPFTCVLICLSYVHWERMWRVLLFVSVYFLTTNGIRRRRKMKFIFYFYLLLFLFLFLLFYLNQSCLSHCGCRSSWIGTSSSGSSSCHR